MKTTYNYTKIWAHILVIFYSVCAFSQDGDATGHFAAPQAPSSGSFSTYIDIPVNAYTGIPNIKYDLLQLPTKSENLNLDFALQYHPNNISQTNSATDVGLGWSLFGAGVISVSVIGDPDRWYNNRPSIPANAQYDDEYYYNFPGQAGKFKINRDPSTGTYSIINQKPNKLKFEFTNSAYPGLEVDSFSITDEKGMKYVFDVYEINAVKNVARINPIAYPYRCSFLLTKVYDMTGAELVNLEYQETYTTSPSGSPIKDNSINKLKSITSHGIGKLEFNFTTNPALINTRNDVSQLNSMVLKDRYGQPVRYINFTYFTVNHRPEVNKPDNVRFLSKFEIADKNNIAVEKYNLEYTILSTDPHPINYYGYSTIIDPCLVDDVFTRNPQSALNGTLAKVILPTGGYIKYDFESHKYNVVDYVSNDLTFENLNLDDDFNESNFTDQDTNTYTFQPGDYSWIYDLDVNPENRIYAFDGDYFYDTHIPNASYPFTLTEDTDLYIAFDGIPYPSEFINDPLFIDYSIKKGSSLMESTIIEHRCLKMRKFKLIAGTYSLNLVSNYGGHGMYTFYKAGPAPNIKKWAFGGGLRIKRISHFAENGLIEPSNTVSYEYTDFNNPFSSSGQMLVEKYISEESIVARVFYKNIKITKGANNGYEKLYYYSPYDKKTSSTGIGYDLWKFFNVLNDGLLNYSESYDTNGRLVKRDKYYYEFKKADNLQYLYFSSRQTSSNFFVNSDYIKKLYVKSLFYSYNPATSISEKTVSIFDETILKLETVTSFDSGNIKDRTDYYYPHDLPNEPNSSALLTKNIIGAVLKSESKSGGDKVLEQRTLYKDWGNNLLAPEIYQSSNGKEPLESKNRITMLDNTNGNTLEIQIENGMKTAFIWGFNKSQLIAKIQNINYNTIPTSLIDAVQNASNAIPYVEQNLLTALQNLRLAPELSTAVFTGYTHKSLVGVSHIIDSKGDIIRYEYDDFGRLKAIYDRNGNLITDNIYHNAMQN